MTTGMSRPRKWLWRIVIALLLLASLAVIARHFATEKLRQAVESALGPNAEVASIETAFSSITLNGIRIKADKDWPAVDELAARRVVVRPDWGALVSRTVRIASIEVEGGYVSMLRRKDGNLALLPSLLGGKDKARAGGAGDPALRQSRKGASMAAEAGASPHPCPAAGYVRTSGFIVEAGQKAAEGNGGGRL